MQWTSGEATDKKAQHVSYWFTVSLFYYVELPQSSDHTQGYSIANDATEQMYIDDDGTVYLYYTGDDGRLSQGKGTQTSLPHNYLITNSDIQRDKS